MLSLLAASIRKNVTSAEFNSVMQNSVSYQNLWIIFYLPVSKVKSPFRCAADQQICEKEFIRGLSRYYIIKCRSVGQMHSSICPFKKFKTYFTVHLTDSDVRQKSIPFSWKKNKILFLHKNINLLTMNLMLADQKRRLFIQFYCKKHFTSREWTAFIVLLMSHKSGKEPQFGIS